MVPLLVKQNDGSSQHSYGILLILLLLLLLVLLIIAMVAFRLRVADDGSHGEFSPTREYTGKQYSASNRRSHRDADSQVVASHRQWQPHRLKRAIFSEGSSFTGIARSIRAMGGIARAELPGIINRGPKTGVCFFFTFCVPTIALIMDGIKDRTDVVPAHLMEVVVQSVVHLPVPSNRCGHLRPHAQNVFSLNAVALRQEHILVQRRELG